MRLCDVLSCCFVIFEITLHESVLYVLKIRENHSLLCSCNSFVIKKLCGGKVKDA